MLQTSKTILFSIILTEITYNMHPDWFKVQFENKTDVLIWLKIDINPTGFKCICYLTDLTNIYLEEINKNEFEKRFSKLNDDLEVEDLADIVKSLQQKLPSDCKSIGRRLNDKIEVEFDWEWDGGAEEDLRREVVIPLKWIFKLSLGTSEQFSELVTKKLFLCLLKQQQDKDFLLEVIKRKDQEIEDYENCGARLSRSSLKTGRFNSQDSIKDHIASPVPEFSDYLADTKFKELLKSSVVLNQSNEDEPPVKKNEDCKTENKDKKRKYVKPNLAVLARKSNANANKKKKLDKF